MFCPILHALNYKKICILRQKIFFRCEEYFTCSRVVLMSNRKKIVICFSLQELKTRKFCQRMSIAAWIVAYVLLGLLLIITLVYVGVLVMRAYTIRKENRMKASNYGFILSPPPSETSGTDTPPSPKRLEASVRPPSEAPFSGKIMSLPE